MSKLRVNRRFLRWFIAHPWLKLIALMLAIIVWLYVRGEISRFNY